MSSDVGSDATPPGDEPRVPSVETVLDDDQARIVVHGDFDASTSPATVDAVVSAMGGRHLTLVTIDMSDAGFVDSTGLGSLVRLRQEARRRGARTRLVGLDQRLEKLLRLTGLDQEFSGN